MTYPDPANPRHWIYNPDGTRTPKPNVDYIKDLINDPKPSINIVNNNNTFDMGDNSIVQLGNGNTVTNPYKSTAKKWYTRVMVWIGGIIASIVLLAVKHYTGW